MKHFIRRLRSSFGASRSKLHGDLGALMSGQERLRSQVGALQLAVQTLRNPATLSEAEFQVYSQFGEDGILQFLIRKLGDIPQTFVEFGVESYEEANTRFLLVNNNWRGLILDGSAENIAAVKAREMYWRHDLTALCAFVDRDNINSLIADNGFAGPIGVLSIDIDGNDYWVWESIRVVEPAIVVAEYNSVFGSQHAVSVPYDAAFVRSQAHHSNLYWGCSLKALCHLASLRGYHLVGSNRAGNNAFFVKADNGSLPAVHPGAAYVESRFRESRDESGALTFLGGRRRLSAIGHLPLVDVETGRTIRAADILEH